MDASPNRATEEQLTRVFVSYAREDRDWLDRTYRYNLVPFLAESLRRQNVVFWFDKQLVPGDEYRRLIETRIDQAQIALLIVSQAFLNSEFIETVEMPRIAERAKLEQMIVVPVLVEPCDWSEYPVLADRQMVPGSTPLIDFTESAAKWAKVKAEILDGLRTQVKRIRSTQLESANVAREQAEATHQAEVQAREQALRKSREAQAQEQAKLREREAEAARITVEPRREEQRQAQAAVENAMRQTVKQLLMWMFAVAGFICLYVLVSKGTSGPKGQTVSYAEVMNRSGRGDVKDVQVDEQTMTGHFGNNDKFRTTIPDNDPEMYQILRNRGVDVTVEDQGTGYLALILASIAPWFVVLFLVLRIARLKRMGAVIQLLIWVTAMAGSVCLYVLVSKGADDSKRQTTSYSLAMNKVLQGQVKDVIIDDKTMVGHYNTGEQFRATIPANDPEMYPILRAHGVNITNRNQSSSYWALILASIAPWFVVLFLVLRIARLKLMGPPKGT